MHAHPQKSSGNGGNPARPTPEPDPVPSPRPPAGDPPPRDPEQPQRLLGKPTRPVEEPPDKPNRGTLAKPKFALGWSVFRPT